MRSARLRSWALVLLPCLLAAGAQGADLHADPWQPVRFLAGVWQGKVSGAAGNGTVERRYEFVLGDNFLQEHNISTYPPQGDKKGEVHRHIGYLSYDRGRDALVLRQFHQESFVNTYVLNRAQSRPALLVFESEAFENFDDSWKARETYEIVSPDEFVETFELAPPGKPFVVYSRNDFRRVK